MSRIVCLGQFTADVVVTTVDSLPEKGKAILVDNISLHNGGCACNTAVALGKLGIDTGVIGKVGRDALGDFLIKVMGDAGLDTAGMVRDPSVTTSSTAVLVHSDGERSFLHYRGGNAVFGEDDMDYDIIEKAEILHVAAALLVGGLDGEPMKRVLARAQDLGVKTCLDTAWDAEGRWDLIHPSLGHLDYFVPSFEEAQMIAGRKDPPEIAEALLKRGIETVIIKLGAEGCYARSANQELSVPGFKVDRVVDTLGAGDSFVAGFLTGISMGWDLEKSCRLANATGACCVSAPGASGIKSLEETLEQFEL
jgi:sugar/nucleoside kinase (ribokinase family)